MRLIRIPRLLFPVLVIGLFFLSFAAHADADTASTGPRPTDSFYLQRERTAPVHVRSQLTQMRSEIQAAGHRYTVGYTTAMDRSLAELTGLKLPADLPKQVSVQFSAQNSLLRAELKRHSDFFKNHPRFKPPPPDATPPFTASSVKADWRTISKVTPIRDQRYCGSCWAFAVMGAYEASYLIRNNTSLDTAEQVLVSCSTGGNCGGGWTGTALGWLQAHGSTYEPSFPYTASNSACHAYTADINLAAWGYIKPDGTVASKAELKQAIVQHGPIIVALYATDKFKAYTSGVFYEQIQAGALNHAVVLVGWDDTKNAWIMRNSWGTGWGETCGVGTERGYMYLGYGSSDVGIWSQWVQAQKLL